MEKTVGAEEVFCLQPIPGRINVILSLRRIKWLDSREVKTTQSSYVTISPENKVTRWAG